MKNLNILKGLVDYVWILGCIPSIIFLPFGYVYGFFEPEAFNILFEGHKAEIAYTNPMLQVIMIIFIVLTFTGIYSFYLFRKTLNYFIQVKPFHDAVILNFKKTGRLLIVVGILGSFFRLVIRAALNNELKLNLGFSPYVLILCLGLFFLILSEAFKVAKHAKEENELTV